MKFAATLMIASASLWLGGSAAPPKSSGIAQSTSTRSSGNTMPLRLRQAATDVATLIGWKYMCSGLVAGAVLHSAPQPKTCT